MRGTPQIARNLETELEKECRLYQDYIELITIQRDSVTKFHVDKLNQLNAKREQFVQQMNTFQERRMAILKGVPNTEGKRLSEVIDQNFRGPEHERLKKLSENLKSLVELARAADREFDQVVQFALNTVNGNLSLLWQGTQNVTKCYSQQGVLTKSFSPKVSRAERVIREA